MTETRLFIDADACPVKAEAERVALRLGVRMIVVSNGGIRPSPHPLVESVFVPDGPDEADKWIAERAGPRDVVVTGDIPLAQERQAITGHSMGGHGALTVAMSFPGRFRSVSAFAPICHPTAGDWGRRQFTAYLGPDEAKWAGHDATLLMRRRGFDGPILVDQGASDQFLDLLRPEALSEAMAARRQEGSFRMQKGYDHSYFFVASFMEEHLGFHARALYD